MSDNTITIRVDRDGTPIKLCIDCHKRTGFGEYAGDRPCPICTGLHEWHIDDAAALDLVPGVGND